ncbi:MAG: DUF523 domain-containing protein [Bacteroidia bacterium]|nr:DUF523 domain-containing protein [Bacteroidia bacterium]
MIDPSYILNLRTPTNENPLRILMSACFTGTLCGYDGTDNGVYPSARKLLEYQSVQIIPFCPEDFSFGTPRAMCDIHGGNGYDVLDGKAKVLTENGIDWTQGMVRAAHRMLEVAQDKQVELAVLMDISAACGSQVIYDGNRFGENPIYQKGPGVCAALLQRNGIQVISQRDFASLELLYAKIDPSHSINSDAIDHHQTEWYQNYFTH